MTSPPPSSSRFRPSHLTLIALRHGTKHPIQSLLLILGVALGVAMIIAIDLANSSASQAFNLSTNSIAGKATHQLVSSSGRIPTEVYQTLRTDLGLQDVAPVVTGYAALEEANGLPLQILGVDPFAEAPFRDYLAPSQSEAGLSLEELSRLLTEPGTVILSSSLAERFGLQTGQTLTLNLEESGGQSQSVTLVGLLGAGDDLSRRALDGLILTDISTAQELLNQVGFVTHIDLILSPTADTAPLLAALPENVSLQRAALRNETLDQMTAAFELNLSALSLLGLVVGMFLIYNTISFSVVQRRPVLGTLRCLGITRREIFGLVLTEALVLSTLGTLIGLGLGIVLGRGLVGLVSQTINDLFFTLTVQGVSLTPLTLYKGVASGLGAGLLAAFIPALEATSVPPNSTLKRSIGEARMQALLPWLTGLGVVMMLTGGLILQLPSQSVVLSFGALFIILIGIAFITPWLTRLGMRLFQPLTNRLGLIGLMAPRDIVRSLSRTSVTIAALMVAVSVIIGVSVMVASFRNTVEDWLNGILGADVFISVATQSQQLSGSVPLDFIEAMQDYPGVDTVGLSRQVEVLAQDLGPVDVNAFSPAPSHTQREFLWLAEGVTPDLATLGERQVFVSEVFARRFEVPLNQPSTLTLLTDAGPQAFQVSGIFFDYASPRGFVLLPLKTYRQFWEDEGVTSVSLYVAETINTETMVTELQDAFASTYQLSIRSNRSIKNQALEIFDRTFTITAALRLLATVVAFIGVLSALMSLQLERTRELGTLRATGMTMPQLWGLTLLETGLMGLLAGLIAMPAGIILAVVLIYVINLRSFGWSLQMQLQPEVFGVAMMVALVAALLAGIYPAWRLGQLKIATALREE